MMSPRVLKVFGISVLLLAAAIRPAWADGDIAKGAMAFKKCMACHEAVKPVNKLGPNLVGLIGRPVASIEGYKYSDAMKAHASTVPVWDEAALDAYLENPKGVVAKTKMAFGGLKKPEERADLIAYLKSLKP
jgi:cytochrome c